MSLPRVATSVNGPDTGPASVTVVRPSASVGAVAPLTVTPATESSSQNLALAALVGLIGVLVVAAVAMLAWRRRAVPLQEK